MASSHNVDRKHLEKREADLLARYNALPSDAAPSDAEAILEELAIVQSMLEDLEDA